MLITESNKQSKQMRKIKETYENSITAQTLRVTKLKK